MATFSGPSWRTPAPVRRPSETSWITVSTTADGVDPVVLTHYHIPHCGQVAEIQRRSGTTVYAHDDLVLVTVDAEARAGVIDRRRQMDDQ